jgi:hypothetical protein
MILGFDREFPTGLHDLCQLVERCELVDQEIGDT